MEYRRLIKFGEATYSISLPKKWVIGNNLVKGALIGVKENNGILQIYPGSRQNEFHKEVTINIENKPLEDIKRNIIAAYINDYTIFNLVGDMNSKVDGIKEVLHSLIGVEILEIDSGKIVAKAFLDVSDAHIDVVIKRIDSILRSMMNDLKSDNVDTHFVFQKDLEINRLYLFALKVITRTLEDHDLLIRFNLTNQKLAFVMAVFEKLEKLADRVKAISKINKETIQSLLDTLLRIEQNYLDAMKAFYSGDREIANTVINQHIQNTKELDALQMKKSSYEVSTMLELLWRMSILTSDIAWSAYDMAD